VLSEAVLVLVIDHLTVLGLRFAHAVALYRHSRQQRDDPLELPFQAPTRFRVQAAGGNENILDRRTF